MNEPGDIDRIIVAVEDIGVDAAACRTDQGILLVIRPTQSFTSAVSAVRQVLPGLHPDAARRLVRTHLPDSGDFEDGTRVVTMTHPPVTRLRRSLVAFAAVLVAVAAGTTGFYIHSYLASQPSVWDNDVFTALDQLGVDCTPTHGIDDLDGHCGAVHVEVAVGGDHVEWTFIRDSHRATLLQTASQAKAEAEQRHLTQEGEATLRTGRYVVYGDAETLPQLWRALASLR